MLSVFASARHSSQFEELRRHSGDPLRSRMRLIRYEWTRWRRGLPGGAYLFTNVEALDPRMFMRACLLADCIRDHDPDALILNDPRAVLRRYELCRTLFRDGINSFDCYRVDEGRVPQRWPVFLRGEYDHYGGAPTLIESPEALAAALAVPSPRTCDRARRLMVEFIDTRQGASAYRKYSVFRIGTQLIPAHLYFGEHWMVKMNRPPNPEELAEEESFIDSNPHAEEVMRVFDRAGIDYGRIDYSVGEHGIEVWEINTNPTVINRHIVAMQDRRHVVEPVIARIADALVAIADQGTGQRPVPFRALRPMHAKFIQRMFR